jgi:acyl-coenzyme A synthetase/AMP-(fatty) acid ligase/acyl carrier protein
MENLERTFNCPVIESYGMTEASHQMASNPLPPMKRKPGSVGFAAGPEVKIMKEEGNNLLGKNVIGEIVIRGDNVTKGYENNPEANKSAFTDGWFRTGDQGYFDSDGYLFLTGRIKEIINRGGEKISPREIDEVLLTHPAVRQALTFSLPDQRLGEDIAAAVILSDDSVDERDLQEFVSNNVAYFKIPRHIYILDEIPNGPTGKLQRIGMSKLLGIEKQIEDEQIAEFETPKTPTEKAIAEIWCELLKIDKVSINWKFFDLGGDSILVGKLINRIRQWFEIDLLYIDFINASTIKEQAIVAEKLILDAIESDQS